MSDDEVGNKESLLLIIGALIDAKTYLGDHEDLAINSLERAKKMIDETIEDIKDE